MGDSYFWLQQWCLSEYIGDWDHHVGVKVDTLDNPGWQIIINLNGTKLNNKQFEKIKFEKSENDWLTCLVRDNNFEGFCGPCNLSIVLHIFRTWAEGGNNALKTLIKNQVSHQGMVESQEMSPVTDDLTWIQQWYLEQCDGDWEHEYGVTFETMEYPGWHMTINLLGTELEGRIFNELKVKRSDSDWMNCAVQGTDFVGQCGPCNLSEVLHIFRTWAEA